MQCTIDVDERDKQGIARRRCGLTQRLEEGEDPFLGLFLRFFPVDAFTRHFDDVAAHYAAHRRARHAITWSRGVFLRFLGIIIRMAVWPLPNVEWHWRWPSKLPEEAQPGVGFAHLMTEAVFK